MRTKTLSIIREQHGRLWLASLDNRRRCNKINSIYWRYVQNIKKALNVPDPFKYKPYHTPIPPSLYMRNNNKKFNR